MRWLVINLDRAPERWAGMERRAAEANIGPLERVQAVDGRTTSLSELPVSLRTRFGMGRPRRDHFSIRNPLAAACAMSHAKAWRAIADSGEDGVVVLEDDATFAAGRRTQELMRIPPDAELVVLGYTSTTRTGTGLRPGGNSVAPEVLPLDFPFYCAAFYWVSPSGARKLLKHAFPIEVHVDVYMGLMAGEWAPAGDRLRAYVSSVNLLGDAHVAKSQLQHDVCLRCGADPRWPWWIAALRASFFVVIAALVLLSVFFVGRLSKGH